MIKLQHWTCYLRRSNLYIRAGSSRARHKRYEKNSILRQNRLDPSMEVAARTGKLLVPLDEIASERRWSYFGRKHLEAVATHSGVYQTIFGSNNSFPIRGNITVSYGPGTNVYTGNILYPRQVSCQPDVSIHCEETGDSDSLYTLILTNLDGNYKDCTNEVLHWMVVNIPRSTGIISAGHTLYPYVSPIPPQGTGVHRLVFTLYSHSSPLKLTPPITDGLSWLDGRSFSSRSFISSHEVFPLTLAFFQTIWDPSVSDTFMELGLKEPVYGLKKELTPRKQTQLAVKEARQQKYMYL